MSKITQFAVACVVSLLFIASIQASELHQNLTQIATADVAARTCSLHIGVDNVQLFSPVASGPSTVVSEDACIASCPAPTWLGSTYKKSTKQCWCIQQPFGSPASGVYNNDFDCRFNANTPTYACASWTVGNQKWMFGTGFNSGTIGPFGTLSNAECAGVCQTGQRGAWTRQRSSTNCWCGNTMNWQSNALLYDTDFDAGVMALW